MSGRLLATGTSTRRVVGRISEAFGRIRATLAAIAAHAVAAGATLIIAHTGHMVRVPGLRVEDWSVKGS